MKFTSALAIAAMYMAGPTLGAKLLPTKGHGAPDVCLGAMYKKSEGVKGPSAVRFVAYPGGGDSFKHGGKWITVMVTDDCHLRKTPRETPEGYTWETKAMAWSDKPSREVVVERVWAIDDVMFNRKNKPGQLDSRFRGFDENGKMLPMPTRGILFTCKVDLSLAIDVVECDD